MHTECFGPIRFKPAPVFVPLSMLGGGGAECMCHILFLEVGPDGPNGSFEKKLTGSNSWGGDFPGREYGSENTGVGKHAREKGYQSSHVTEWFLKRATLPWHQNDSGRRRKKTSYINIVHQYCVRLSPLPPWCPVSGSWLQWGSGSPAEPRVRGPARRRTVRTVGWAPKPHSGFSGTQPNR